MSFCGSSPDKMFIFHKKSPHFCICLNREILSPAGYYLHLFHQRILPVVTFKTAITVQKKYYLVLNSYLNSTNFACVENLIVFSIALKILKRYKYKATADSVIQSEPCLLVCLFSFNRRPPCQVTNITGFYFCF